MNDTEVDLKVKNELDLESDCDNNDTFFNELNDEDHDSSSSEVINKKSDNINSKSEKTANDKAGNETKASNKYNKNALVTKQILRKIPWQCYKCNIRLRSAQRLQDHFQVTHSSKIVEYVCIECNAVFKKLHEFKSHYYSHDIIKKTRSYEFNFSCEICGKQFYHLSNYRVHRNSHLGLKRFECEICGRNFAKKQYKEMHKLTVCLKSIDPNKNNSHSDERATINEEKESKSQDGEELSENNMDDDLKWKCDKCDKSFARAYNLQRHNRNVHGITNNKQHICTVCDEIFENNDKYDEHLKIVHNLITGTKTGSVYKCNKCSKQFNYKYAYLAHALIHTGVKRFPCKECGRKFHLKQHLTAHLITHLESKNEYEVKCDQCGKICKNQYLLDKHLRTHQSIDEKCKHQCDICKRTFSYLKSLITHQNQGHENVEYICDQCGKVFKTKYRLSEHLNTHDDAVIFSCDECPKGFKSAYILKIHKLTHSGVRSYGCEVCGKQFRRQGELTRHSSIHTGKLPHECSYCKKQFREKYYLKVHLRQHTGERPYSCTICNHYFANDGNFAKHIKRKHGVQNVSIANKRQYPFDE
ncbi:zinc finger protein 883-like [Chrysoperla carnea]|uniref:zinc finger protein 883-like n=1 Tax=Chrysoperla carnea TaxID=189513 RepID=UPI001D05E290|nr:zinc finger protein 883-like [Chrysoperla carnea]